jgi:hypothetical protein
MADIPKTHEAEYVHNMSQHYKQASEELLHAYQRNKEAARHHEAGAFKAALHHAKLSKHHSFNAHAHLTDALGMAEKLDAAQLWPSLAVRPPSGSGVH